jgi:hypothetical protein
VFILKADKVLCFDTLLQVFILKGLIETLISNDFPSFLCIGARGGEKPSLRWTYRKFEADAGKEVNSEGWAAIMP